MAVQELRWQWHAQPVLVAVGSYLRQQLAGWCELGIMLASQYLGGHQGLLGVGQQAGVAVQRNGVGGIRLPGADQNRATCKPTV